MILVMESVSVVKRLDNAITKQYLYGLRNLDILHSQEDGNVAVWRYYAATGSKAG